jgi:hypothetical protein
MQHVEYRHLTKISLVYKGQTQNVSHSYFWLLFLASSTAQGTYMVEYQKAKAFELINGNDIRESFRDLASNN